MGAVETLICWENLDIIRYKLKNSAGGRWFLWIGGGFDRRRSYFPLCLKSLSVVQVVQEKKVGLSQLFWDSAIILMLLKVSEYAGTAK